MGAFVAHRFPAPWRSNFLYITSDLESMGACAIGHGGGIQSAHESICSCRLAIDGNRVPKAQRMEEGLKDSEFRIAAFREHAIQTFLIQLCFLGERRNSSLGLRNISQCPQKQFWIILFERGIQILFSFPRISQAFNKICLVGRASFS